jgi:hypothetical protein
MRFGRKRPTAPSLWFDAVLAVLSFVLFALTLFSRDWIEVVLRVDPDRHSGSLEWLIVGMSAAAMVSFTARARSKWRSAAQRS